jgi:hypothetical protein
VIEQNSRQFISVGDFSGADSALIDFLKSLQTAHGPELLPAVTATSATPQVGFISRPPAPPRSNFADWIDGQVELAQLYLARDRKLSDQNTGFKLLKLVCKTPTPEGMQKQDIMIVARAQLVLAQVYGERKNWSEAIQLAESARALYLRAEGGVTVNNLIAGIVLSSLSYSQDETLEWIKDHRMLLGNLNNRTMNNDQKVDKILFTGDLYLSAYHYANNSEMAEAEDTPTTRLREAIDPLLQVLDTPSSLIGPAQLWTNYTPQIADSAFLRYFPTFKARLLDFAIIYYGLAKELIENNRGQFHPSILTVLKRLLEVQKTKADEGQIEGVEGQIEAFYDRWAQDAARA